MDKAYSVGTNYHLLVDHYESPFLTTEDLMLELICLRLTEVRPDERAVIAPRFI